MARCPGRTPRATGSVRAITRAGEPWLLRPESGYPPIWSQPTDLRIDGLRIFSRR